MKTSRSLASLLLVACSLCLAACKTGSTLLSNEPTIKPQPPLVRCKKPATPPLAKSPRKDEWVSLIYVAGQPKAQLSEASVQWIADLVATLDKEREYRKQEHACLDDNEKKGYITQ